MMHNLLMALITLLFSSTLIAQETYKKPAFVFAAGNLKFVFPQLIKKFYKKHPYARVYIQYGSSGYLANSILKGKQYDIFFSANIKYPVQIYKAKKSATKPKNYAQGKLILFVPKTSNLATRKIQVLTCKDIPSITIANTSTAPYGVAALEVLKSLNYYDAIKHKIIHSSDVATAIDNVIWKGSAGFLSKSALYMLPDNRKAEGVDWMEIDEKYYQPIIQAYVVSDSGLKNENTVKFLNFMESKAGQQIFKENGYKNIISN